MNFEEILDGVVIHDWKYTHSDLSRKTILVKGHLQDDNNTMVSMTKEFTCDDCLRRMFKFMKEGVK